MKTAFQVAIAALKLKHKQVSSLMRSTDNQLWRNLEYGDKSKIIELAQNYDMYRQQFEKLDDGQRYAQDVDANINQIENGKCSKSLQKKYNKLAALKKIVQSDDYERFFMTYPPSERLETQIIKIPEERIPDFIRTYMVESKVQPDIFNRVCNEFPLPQVEQQVLYQGGQFQPAQPTQPIAPIAPIPPINYPTIPC
ncbi:hypothetical protein TVAG_337040 [Trichomonas vaginalis G3]|uniref:Uncharacterized protein n=1 Tax=Trichomonas vaginalis (strain ATCC PRA-98 / G3) TaxID=412133 RepID=A2EPX4_TRIV3|nr:hypothetical protein TVAGG3_0359540 [Trichomonas vaginalis G3]EAY05312.1 hypothetical protein TVAG_337040 [Trichomonas vaginalis G3]KAI5531852.1 hypothetical protein TVAGG3_0359540 [Trichomonas vaginalis G3]|eukprot:XP_001317535.1 hypothetical protein [Trichomonas vaginalis G3]